MGVAFKLDKEAGYWTASEISDVKRDVRNELEVYGKEHGQRAKLKYIFQCLNELGETPDSHSLLRSFVYVVSALVHHLRHGGLQGREIRRLSQIGRNCLRLQGIVPGRSKTSFLYGELHMALSQVYGVEGNLWQASWDQLIAKYATRDEPVGGITLHELSLGRRALRLGYGETAIHHLEAAMKHAGKSPQGATSGLALVKALRLAGRYEQASILIVTLKGEQEFVAAQHLELGWESAWLQLQSGGDFRGILSRVGDRGEHHSGEFISEAKMAAYAIQSREFMDRFSKVATYMRRAIMTPSGLGAFYHCLEALEDCYNKDIPSINRLDTVAQLLEDSSEIVSIEKELLFLAAAARWLARANLREFAAQVLARYRSISWSLSSGKNADSLGLVGDLMQKDWFA